VAHICNLSYLGGRDQGDPSSKPAWANSLSDSSPQSQKHPSQKKRLVEWFKVYTLSSSPSTEKKKKQKKSAFYMPDTMQLALLPIYKTLQKASCDGTHL
jgi:hypothetical protein